MSESQKGKSVQRNQVGNQKQGNSSDQESNNTQDDTSKKSSGSEDKNETTEEINEQKDFKHPHKQGNPSAFDDNNENGI